MRLIDGLTKNAAYDLYFVLYSTNGVDFHTTALAVGDVKESDDDGVFGSITPTLTQSFYWKMTFSAGDMNVDDKIVKIVDQTAPKAFMDITIHLKTGEKPAASVTGNVSGNVVGTVASVVASVVTDAASRTASKADVSNLDAAVSSRSSHSATDIWSVGSRTLTSFGTLVSDIWNNASRTLSSFSTALALSVWDVLESAIITGSSIGLKLKTNLDALISSRSSHAAADIWSVGTRTLTSFGSLVADTVTAVWAAGSRTLTSFGTLIADIWTNVTRTITGGTVGTVTNDVTTDTASRTASKANVSSLALEATVAAIQIDVTEVLDYEAGDWEIVNDQMIFKTKAGATLATYDLTKAGVPDSDAPDKRVKV